MLDEMVRLGSLENSSVAMKGATEKQFKTKPKPKPHL